MQTEFHFGKKKDVYPSKKTINLYYQEDRSTRYTAIILDTVFVAVVVLALVKFLIVDVLNERSQALQKVEDAQILLEQQMDVLADYDEISEEYVKYSFRILVEDMNIYDRMEILEMLEETIFADAKVSHLSIMGNVISVNFSGTDLNRTAQLIERLQEYEMVSSVTINNQQGGSETESYNANMLITLKEKGGEQ